MLFGGAEWNVETCSMKAITTLILLSVFAVSASAQHHCISRNNGSAHGLGTQTERDLQRWLAQHPQVTSSREVLQIPTVVHVIWKNPQENIADSLIHRTLQLVNFDLSRQNDDTANTPSHFLPVAASMGIELVLATTDPNGNPTDGITRTYSDSIEFSQFHENMKYDATGGKSAWNPEQYLNIWTVRSIDGGNFGTVLGMSTMPGLEYEVPGLVIKTDRFMNYGVNNFKNWRSLTHELGHFFCLHHLCGTDVCYNADFVDDTPICDNLADFTSACSDSITQLCDTPFGDMRSNFMGYSEPRCHNLFTQGQRERAIGCINTNYPGLISSPGLGIGSVHLPSIAIYPNPANNQLWFEAKQIGNYTLLDMMGRVQLSGMATIGQNAIDISALPNGIYLLRVTNGGAARMVKVGN